MFKKVPLSQWFTATTLSIYLIVREQQWIPSLWQLPKELDWLVQRSGWITCAWVLLESLQEQRHGPQRPGTPGASAAQDKLLGWFYGEVSEGKACSLSVQGLQWPFLGLSAGVSNTEKSFTGKCKSGRALLHKYWGEWYPFSWKHLMKYQNTPKYLSHSLLFYWTTFCPPTWSRISLHSEILNIFKGQEKRKQSQVLPQFCLLPDVKRIRRERKKREARERDED